jgi:protein tyrosine phosphatase
MIIEYKVPLILMLTKEVEGGRTKCDRYWPLKKNTLYLSDNYESLRIINEEEEKLENEIIHRKIKIYKKVINENEEESEEEFLIDFLQYEGLIFFFKISR